MLQLKHLYLTALITTTSLIVGCGGGGGSSSTTKTPAPAPTPTSSEQCASRDMATGMNCITLEGRDTLAYIPATINDETSLAIFLHGAPGETDKVMNIFNGKQIADTYNMISLAPEGNKSDYEWDSQVTNSGNINLDINYLLSLIDEVRSQQGIAGKKVYVFGYSAGGFMAYKLACLIPESITAIVALAGQYRGNLEACPTATPINIHHFHSPFDKDVPYSGREFGSIASVADTIALWSIKNGCSGIVTSEEAAGVTATSDKTTTEFYQDCSHSLALSIMETVDHEDDYQADKLLNIYQYLLQ